jgi:hypothetical protein
MDARVNAALIAVATGLAGCMINPIYNPWAPIREKGYLTKSDHRGVELEIYVGKLDDFGGKARGPKYVAFVDSVLADLKMCSKGWQLEYGYGTRYSVVHRINCTDHRPPTPDQPLR